MMQSTYRVVPAHRNWQIETAAWSLAGFLHCALETRWQRFGHFLNVFLDCFLNDFLYKNLNFFNRDDVKLAQLVTARDF